MYLFKRDLWLLLIIFVSSPIYAGSFKVFPLKLELDQNTKTTLFKITNTGNNQVTVQLEVVKWFQNEKGEDRYEPTRDIVYFPKIVKVDAGQQRIIRLGYRGKKNVIKEKTYRIFAQELPELGEQKSALKFSLRFSVPIFVDVADNIPQSPIARLQGVSLLNGKLQVQVKNDGDKHLVVKSVNVSGVRYDGQQLFEAKSGGWYVLPEVTKPFLVNMPENECRQSEELNLKIETTAGSLKDMLSVDKSQCVAITEMENRPSTLSFSQ